MTDEILEVIPAETVFPSPLPGKILAQAREEKGMSVADVARSLRLSVKQIAAIETDDFDKLPGKTFLRGFIRNYARLLQIDPEPLLQGRLAVEPHQDFQAQAISAMPCQVEFSTPRGQRTFSNQPRPWLKYLLAALIVLVLVGGAAYQILGGSEMRTVVVKPAGNNQAMPLPTVSPQVQADVQPLALPRPEVQQQTPVDAQPLALPPPATTPAPKVEMRSAPVQPQPGMATTQGDAKVNISFLGESWIDLKDKSGRTIYKQTGYAGNEQTITGTPPLSLTVGKAVNVKVQYNDKPVDLTPYRNGDVARLNLE